MNKKSIRKATKKDIPLILDFIKKLSKTIKKRT